MVLNLDFITAKHVQAYPSSTGRNSPLTFSVPFSKYKRKIQVVEGNLKQNSEQKEQEKGAKTPCINNVLRSK